MRVKEYLSVRGIGFQSIDVVADAAGRAELERLGARSVPVVARGGRFVFAQVIGDVAAFLGLPDDGGPQLAPAELASRFAAILEAAIRLTRQMPDSALENQLPNRPRAWRVLMHHIFQIPAAFLDMEEGGGPLSYENLVAPPPDTLAGSAAIAEFGAAVRRRFIAWWARVRDEDFDRPVETYFGRPSRHEMLERTVWHATQHVRQLAALLEQAGIMPDRPPVAADLAGLPLTEKVWDDAQPASGTSA